MCLAWGPNEFRGASEFVVCSGDEIRIFSFRHSSRGNLEADNTWMIDDVDFTIQSVALTEAFVIGTSEDKKIHIWSRRTGELLHENLCDVEEQDEVDAGDIFHSLPLSCHGNIMVTTSHKGCALCVWDMKKGELLKRYNHAEEEMNVNMLPEGTDCTDMTYLEPLNGFVCVAGNMNVWAFPVNKRQAEMAQSIKRREEMLQKALYL